MANIRIDNFSGDTVTVFIDGKEAVLEDEGRITLDTLGKGAHTLHIHRTRIPFENLDSHEAQTQQKPPFGATEKSLHTQLDLVAELDVNSSKAVVAIKTDVTSAEGKGMDAIFSSYSLGVTGARVEGQRKVFANSAVEKSCRSHHIRNVIFPAGVGGFVIFLLGLVALASHLAGNTLNLGGTQFTLPWSLGLTAVGTGILVYTLVCIVNVVKVVKGFKR